MKVLLLKNVPKVGKKDEVVEVAEGYANHALFPKKLAVPATAAAVASRDRRRQNVAAEQEIRHRLLDTMIQGLASKELSMKVKANGQGHLFSRVHPADIVKFLATHRIEVSEASLVLPEIKTLGAYTIGIQDRDYRASFALTLTT
jgi:large subunit ribosomal protein L9